MRRPPVSSQSSIDARGTLGVNHPLWKAITRLTRFGYLRQAPGHPDVYEVRSHIPPLSRAQVERLPMALQATAPSV